MRTVTTATSRAPGSGSEPETVLPDVLAPGLRIVFCGTAASAKSAEVGAPYAGPGNYFWPALHEAGFTPRRLHPQEFREVLAYGIGLTDLCKTRSGSDREVGTGAFDRGRLLATLQDSAPAWVAFTSKAAGKAALGRPVDYGEQPELFGGARSFVLPSPSGLARGFWDIERWRELARLAGSA
jgi:double-stranded uracil-DNA glycosylase